MSKNVHLGDGHMEAKCGWPSVCLTATTHCCLLPVHNSPRSRCLAVLHCETALGFKSSLVFLRITFAALTSLRSAFCLRGTICNLVDTKRTTNTFHREPVHRRVSAHHFVWCEVLKAKLRPPYFLPEDNSSALALNVFTPCDLSSSR